MRTRVVSRIAAVTNRVSRPSASPPRTSVSQRRDMVFLLCAIEEQSFIYGIRFGVIAGLEDYLNAHYDTSGVPVVGGPLAYCAMYPRKRQAVVKTGVVMQAPRLTYFSVRNSQFFILRLRPAPH